MDKTRHNLSDNNTIFGKILRKEIPADIVYEDDKALAFHDANPRAKVHVLVIPKQHLTCLRCMETEDAALMAHLLGVINKVADKLGVTEKGFRVVTNAGEHGGQTVPHLHFHLMAGEELHDF